MGETGDLAEIDPEEDAAVLELQHGLHGVSHVQTVHLRGKGKSLVKPS